MAALNEYKKVLLLYHDLLGLVSEREMQHANVKALAVLSTAISRLKNRYVCAFITLNSCFFIQVDC